MTVGQRKFSYLCPGQMLKPLFEEEAYRVSAFVSPNLPGSDLYYNQLLSYTSVVPVFQYVDSIVHPHFLYVTYKVSHWFIIVCYLSKVRT